MTRKKGRGSKNPNMSRQSQQPPLPLGPPPSLTPRPYQAAESGFGGDSYRPQGGTPPRQFRGSGGSYRPSYDRATPPRDRDRDRDYQYESGGQSRDDYPGAPARNSDSYRPNDDNFNFRYEAPPSLNFGQFGQTDTYRPRSPPRQGIYSHDNNNHQRQNNYARENNNYNRQSNHAENRRGPARGGYRGRGAYRGASDRDFLKTNRAPTPELMPGMDEDVGNGVRYKPVEELSDSEEAEMDLSDSDDEEENAQQPKKKQVRTETKAADGDSVPEFAPIPKWSNPDPYTALPPPDDSQRKKKDVVKLIRKARVSTSSDPVAKTEAATDDFISFDFGDEDLKETNSASQFAPGVEGAPTGPRFSHRDNVHKQMQPAATNQFVSINAARSETKGQMRYSNNELENVPQASTTDIQDRIHRDPKPQQTNVPAGNSQPLQNITNQASSKNKLPVAIDLTSDSAPASRKRALNGELKNPPQIHELNSKGNRPSNGAILPKWQSSRNTPTNPWLSMDHSASANMGVWLHKEVVDFYHWVKPRDFEQYIRSKLVEELQLKITKAWKRDAYIFPFGSFPAGLYLPTADMDLVCVSDSYRHGGHPLLGSRSTLHKFKDFLLRQNLALNDDVEIISGAKVPLVKYADRVTGLKIDISFENNTGLIANQTFQDWKTQFPAMPIIVTIIKHYLAMRGLNEPVNGGIGGFSVICLVVSLLQNMPQIQSGSMIPEHHLGEILMEFFNLYGNKFNFTTTAIALNPPAWLPKHQTGLAYRGNTMNMEKFSIIDPNNSSNDICGGASNTETILNSFAHAYRLLQSTMSELKDCKDEDRRDQSLLDCILGGNYSSFDLQREHLAHVHENLFGPVNRAT